MKRWWRDWGLVDLLGVGLALALAASYASRYASDDPIGALWPNVATEIFGVWLSVRIIGAWVESRQRRHTIRSQLVGHLNLMTAQLEDLFPHLDTHVVTALRREIAWFDRLQSHRFSRLDATEQSKTREAVDAARDLPELALQLRAKRGEVRATSRGIDLEHAGPALMGLREVASRMDEGSLEATEVEEAVEQLEGGAEEEQRTIGDIGFVRSFASGMKASARLEQDVRDRASQGIELLRAAAEDVLEDELG